MVATADRLTGRSSATVSQNVDAEKRCHMATSTSSLRCVSIAPFGLPVVPGV
jgi:hypothetical protein